MSVVLGPVCALAQVAYVLPELLPPPELKASAKKPATDEPLMIPVPTVRLTLGLTDMPVIQGVPLERPQALTVLRNRLAGEVPPVQPALPVEKTAQPDTMPATSTTSATSATAPVTPSPTAPAEIQQPAPENIPAPNTILPQRTEHLSALEESTTFGAPSWITEVSMPHAGVHHFIMETKPTWTPALNRFVQHVAKTLQPSQDNLELWDKSSGLDFDILPLTRPFSLCAGMSFSGQIVHEGRPVPHAVVEAVWLPDVAVGRRKTPKPLQSTEQVLKADAEGIFTITCPWAGWWGFSAVTSGGDPLKDPDGNLKPVDLKTTLWVPMSTCTPGAAS